MHGFSTMFVRHIFAAMETWGYIHQDLDLQEKL